MKNAKIYTENLEATAFEQFESAMAMPYAKQWALMPDAHTWYTLPIGAVVATQWVVVPSWVWYDIWCWMSAFNLNIKKEEIESYREDIFNEIYRQIPTGFNKHKNNLNKELLWKLKT